MSETIAVYCQCGAELNTSWSQRENGGIIVDPCDKCLTEARKESHQEGYDEGYSEGESTNE